MKHEVSLDFVERAADALVSERRVEQVITFILLAMPVAGYQHLVAGLRHLLNKYRPTFNLLLYLYTELFALSCVI